MKDKKIKYLKPPVSAEDKAKYQAEGFKILDARFEPQQPKAKAKPKKAKKVEDGGDDSTN